MSGNKNNDCFVFYVYKKIVNFLQSKVCQIGFLNKNYPFLIEIDLDRVSFEYLNTFFYLTAFFRTEPKKYFFNRTPCIFLHFYSHSFLYFGHDFFDKFEQMGPAKSPDYTCEENAETYFFFNFENLVDS